jgi:ABC-type lipoprotein export system ATPase subunit
MPLLSVRDVHKMYASGESAVAAVRGISLDVEQGSFIAIVGPSGCGKSTLLHLCGAMDRPSKGSVVLGEQRFESLDEEELTRVRRERIGFVFQFFNLLPTLTAEENIALPLLLAGRSPSSSRSHARDVAGRVGVSHRLHMYPQQLSGGEMQRVAIARAVVHEPELLLADEPTGNLDSETGARILALIRDLNVRGLTIQLATHAPELAAAADRVVHLHDGRIERIEERSSRPAGASSGAV